MRRAAARLIAITLALASPFLAGSLEPRVFLAFFAIAFAVAAWAVARRSARATHATLVLVSVALATTAFDLVLRLAGLGPVVFYERWPPLPHVNRFVPNVDRADIPNGDLAAMAGKAAPDAPPIHLVTDASGFRNDPRLARQGVEVIVLGDSFGAGAVSNDATIRAWLARDHALRAIDLSTPASSPWQEYVNLRVEQDRIDFAPGATLAWLIFGGNDLDEYYGPPVETLRFNGEVRQRLFRMRAWRDRSPLRYLLQRNAPSKDVFSTQFPGGGHFYFYRPYIDAAARGTAAIRAHANFPALRATIAGGVALARSRGLRPVIFLIPAKEEVYAWVHRGAAPWSSPTTPSGFTEALLAICRDEKLACFDLKPDLVLESRRAYEKSGTLLYWRDDSHLNAEGNRFVAARMRALLRGE